MGCTPSDNRPAENNQERYLLNDLMSYLRKNIHQIDIDNKLLTNLNKSTNTY